MYYLFGHIIHSWLEWQKTEYILTNKRIITKRGVLGMHYLILELDKILQTEIQITIIDRIFNTGSLFFLTEANEWPKRTSYRSNPFMWILLHRPPNIVSIRNFFEVQKIIDNAIKRAKDELQFIR